MQQNYRHLLLFFLFFFTTPFIPICQNLVPISLHTVWLQSPVCCATVASKNRIQRSGSLSSYKLHNPSDLYNQTATVLQSKIYSVMKYSILPFVIAALCL